MGRKVLVVEDDRDIARLVKLQLTELSCEVGVCHDGAEGLRQAESKNFDLVVLDLMLPGIDGLAICRGIRARKGPYTPILMLTAKSSELDRVLGLEMGADDYLTKPFSLAEFAARVKALFRRVDSLGDGVRGHAPLIEADGLRIDAECRSVSVDGRPVELTAKEFDLLLQFARNPGRVYTRAQLLDLVWGYSHSSYEHTVNSHINRLRAKVEPDPDAPRFIQTVWGVGYKFREPGPREC
ncbi:MAG: response regulator transcription factor [Rhodocyclaceae bacterium]|nr:response regulator transcription factor [Rhodocyclaceae bacterium]